MSSFLTDTGFSLPAILAPGDSNDCHDSGISVKDTDAPYIWANCTVTSDGTVTVECNQHIPVITRIGAGRFLCLMDLDFVDKESFTPTGIVGNMDWFYEDKAARTSFSFVMMTVSGLDPRASFGVTVHGCLTCCEAESANSSDSIPGDAITVACCPDAVLSTILCVTVTNLLNAPLLDGLVIRIVYDPTIVWTPPFQSNLQHGAWFGCARVNGCPSGPSSYYWVCFTLGCYAPTGKWYWNQGEAAFLEGTPPIDVPVTPSTLIDSISCDPFGIDITSDAFANFCYFDPLVPIDTSVLLSVGFCPLDGTSSASSA